MPPFAPDNPIDFTRVENSNSYSNTAIDAKDEWEGFLDNGPEIE